jgi:hypothetical protein
MEEKSKSETIRKNSKKPSVSKVVGALVVLAVLAFAGLMTFKYQDLKKNPQKQVQAEQKSLISKVTKLIKLPTDETPSIATVSDKEKLKEQAFFVKAENGDTLLIYTAAKQAILYREKDNQIVQVAPIAIDTATPGTTPAATAPVQ